MFFSQQSFGKSYTVKKPTKQRKDNASKSIQSSTRNQQTKNKIYTSQDRATPKAVRAHGEMKLYYNLSHPKQQKRARYEPFQTSRLRNRSVRGYESSFETLYEGIENIYVDTRPVRSVKQCKVCSRRRPWIRNENEITCPPKCACAKCEFVCNGCRDTLLEELISSYCVLGFDDLDDLSDDTNRVDQKPQQGSLAAQLQKYYETTDLLK